MCAKNKKQEASLIFVTEQLLVNHLRLCEVLLAFI